MKILIASDHAGFELKNRIKDFLIKESFDIEDMGASALNPEDNYTEIMIPVAMRVLEDSENTKAIIFGKSGQGEAMVSNRFPGIRCSVYYGGNTEILKLSREHNNANILSIGADFINEEETKNAIKIWISTPFSGEERHIRRIDQMDNIQ